MTPRLLLILLSAILALGSRAADSLRVSFVNFYPGAEVYELEGHSALRISTPDSDIAVTYGVFSFDQPNFIYRFVKGETDYSVAAVPWRYFVQHYLDHDRRVVEHHIRLDSTQQQKLMQLLDTNLLPQNRVYRYNYVKDNCATRPLRILEQAIGDSICLPAPDAPVSYRDVMRRYHRNYPWYQFGIDLSLGPGIDYEINARELAFAPVVLDSLLLQATAGSLPLLTGTTVLNEGSDATLPPTPWPLHPLTVCWAIFAIGITVTVADLHRHRVSRWLDALLFGVLGIEGLVLTFLIFVSVHEATSPNYLYAWLNPVALIVPALIWLKKCRRLVTLYFFVNFVVVLCFAVTWPFSPQQYNPAFLPLVLLDIARSASYLYITKYKPV